MRAKRNKKPVAPAPAPDCPYCGQAARLMLDSSPIYHGRNFGPLWICDDCQAWVGTHKTSKRHAPLGRLANAELRAAKTKAHAAFDPLWKRKMQRDGCKQYEARAAAYAWLSEKMAIPAADTHIGMFDLAQCAQVVALCSPFHKT